MYHYWLQLQFHCVGDIPEEVVVKDAGDAPKLLYVYIFLFEDFVDIGTCAA